VKVAAIGIEICHLQHDKDPFNLVQVRFVDENLGLHVARVGRGFSPGLDPTSRIEEATEAWPIDGRDLHVAGGRVLPRGLTRPSGKERGNRLRSSDLAVPPQDMDPEVTEIDGILVGWGCGLEEIDDMMYCVPYLSVQVIEVERTRRRAVVIHARMTPKGDPDSRIDPEKGEFPLRTPAAELGVVPKMFNTLRQAYSFGTDVVVSADMEEGYKFEGIPTSQLNAVLKSVQQKLG